MRLLFFSLLVLCAISGVTGFTFARGASAANGSSQVAIPMVPDGIYVGMTTEEFEQLRPTASRVESLLEERNGSNSADAANRDAALFLEHEERGAYIMAAAYCFVDGLCTSISIEENLSAPDFGDARDGILNSFFNLAGDGTRTMLLHQEKPLVRQSPEIVTRGSSYVMWETAEVPSVMWETKDIRVILTISPDRSVQDRGVGRIFLRVARRVPMTKFNLSPVDDISEDERFSAIEWIRNMRKTRGDGVRVPGRDQ